MITGDGAPGLRLSREKSAAPGQRPLRRRVRHFSFPFWTGWHGWCMSVRDRKCRRWLPDVSRARPGAPARRGVRVRASERRFFGGGTLPSGGPPVHGGELDKLSMKVEQFKAGTPTLPVYMSFWGALIFNRKTGRQRGSTLLSSQASSGGPGEVRAAGKIAPPCPARSGKPVRGRGDSGDRVYPGRIGARFSRRFGFSGDR